MESGIGILEQLIRHNSVKSIFRRRKPFDDDDDDNQQDIIDAHDSSPKPLSRLSPIANSVVSRCSKALHVSNQTLQQRFESEFPTLANDIASASTSSPTTTTCSYARNLLEYCSFRALHILTLRSDYLSDKDFRRLTFDMMLAWEEPSATPCVDPTTNTQPHSLLNNTPLHTTQLPHEEDDEEEEDGWSLFYTNSISMAVQVDGEKTVGPEAFARIAPACPAIADIITVHNLFDVLTSSSAGQLHFLIYDKYLGSLDKVIKTAKSASGPPLCSNLQLDEGEIVLNVDGSVPTQPVLQHVGISAWPGRLTLTNYALYFETGVGLYDKAVRYDLAMELKQVVKPQLTGPLGARLFDKAVMYKSISVAEPVYFEFPEFKGHSRRDYWLENILEVLYAHRFIRKYKFKGTRRMEALAKATLGIFRLRAVREAFHIFPSHYKTLLDYNLAEKLPRGDMILETLSSRLELLASRIAEDGAVSRPSNDAKQLSLLYPISLMALAKLGFILPRGTCLDEGSGIPLGDVCVGETNPLEVAVKHSKCDMGRAETAQATVDQVKIEGIDTNIAVMKELLFPVLESVNRLHFLASWEDRFKSTVFLVLVCYAIYRDWIKYALPCFLIFLALLVLWHKHRNRGKPLEAFRVTPPPSKNAVEQLLALQEAVSDLETSVQAGNIVLLKLRALLFSALPQASDKVALGLIIVAGVFAFMPLRMIAILILVEMFTREMPWRKERSDRWLRRVREWWVRVPAAPVRFVPREEDSKRK